MDFKSCTVSARSVRFRISPGAASETFSLGSFYAGEVVDLGGIHSAGGLRTPFQNRLETPLANGGVVLTRIGDSGVVWTMPWNAIPLSLRTTFYTAQARSGTLVLVDAGNGWREVFMRGGSLAEGRTGGPELYDINFELVSLP